MDLDRRGKSIRRLVIINPHSFEKWNIPGCTYSRPQVASVGLTEAKAREAGHELKVGKFPFNGNGKAIALGEAEGFVKTVFDAKTGARKLVGLGLDVICLVLNISDVS